jgi:hypothetical protein
MMVLTILKVVANTTFIRLKVPIQLAKTTKEENK